MSETTREGSFSGQEDIYKFSTFDALEKALENNGWKKDKVHQFFRSLPKELTDSFPERSMTRSELKEYASKLDAAQTRYEQINLLKQVALKGLREEIGATISFENLGDLAAALEERGITYPKGYLEQTGSSFLSGWGTSRSLTMTSYESMIKVLTTSENEEEYIRGQIIAKAFNTPIEQKAVSHDAIKEVYPDKNTAFAQSIKGAKSFPFVVTYSEDGKSYELPVSTQKNTVILGGKTITLTNDQISIESIVINGENFVIHGKKGFITGTETVSKDAFIEKFLPKFLSNTSSSIDLSGYHFQVGVNGVEKPKELLNSTPIIHNPSEAENIHEKPPLVSSTASQKEGSEVRKYPLSAYEGYALRHLERAGKTIVDLQNALISKNIAVNPTGEFDKQTLDAVFAFQKTIQNPTFGPDGLIGSLETIPALFGITPRPNIDRDISQGSRNSVAKTSTEKVTAVPVSNKKSSKGLSFDERMSQLQSEFQNGYTQIPGKLSWIKDGNTPFHISVNADKQSISLTDAQNKPVTGPYTPHQIEAYNHIAEKIGLPRYNSGNTPNKQFFPVGGPQLRGGVRDTENNSERMKKIQDAYDGFMREVKRIDSQDGMLFDSAENIQRHRGEVNKALLNFSQAVGGINRNTLTEEEKKYFDAKYINIAHYFTNDLSGVSNRQYKDYDLAFGFALLLVQDDLQRQNIQIPQKPTEESVLSSVSKTNPSLHKKLVDGLRNGYTLSQILSNPQVRGQFDEVYEAAYKKYETDFQSVLTKLKNERPNLSSNQGQAALDLMMSVMGTQDWNDIKARNLDMIGKTAGMVGSTVAGILAAAATPFTGGVTAPVSAALLGGAVTTGGMILTSGRGGLDRETFTEAGINVAMFGLGGTLLKGTRMIRESGITLARTTGYSLDAAGGLALGVSADYVRSWEANAEFNLSTSLKYNLPWALLPFALGSLKAFKPRAEKLKSDMDVATQQAKLGDHAGAAATLKQKVEPEAKALADDVKKTQEKVVDTSHEATPPKEKGKEGTETPTKNITPKDSVDTAKAPDTPSDFSIYLAQLIPAKNKLKGVIVDTPDLKILAQGGNKYQVTHGKNVYDFDSHADMVKGVSKIVPDSKLQMTLLSKLQQSNIKSLDQTEVSPGLRFSTKDGEVNFQKKDPTTGGWMKAELKDISDDDAVKALSAITGKNPTQIKKAMTEASHTKIDDHVSSKEKQNFIKKYGEKAWGELQGGFNRAISTMKEAPGAAAKGTLGLLKFATGWNSKQGWLQSLFWGGVVPQVVEGIAFGNGTDEDELNMKNTGEALAFATVYKFFGLRGSLIAGILYAYKKYDGVSNPDAQPVIPPSL